MSAVILFIAILAVLWIVINLVYRKYLCKYSFISLKYGVLLVIKKSSSVKPSGVIGKIGSLLIALYVFALVVSVYTAVSAVYMRFTGREPGVAILIPGVNVTGVDLVMVLVAVCIAAYIHEYMHAKVAASSNIAMRGFGVVVALVIPIAFVEVDEYSFEQAAKSSRVKVLVAGVAGNIILYFAALLLLLCLTQSAGVLVTSVYSGSLAEEHGIKPYDVILAVNETRVVSISTIREYMSLPENTTLKLTAWRHGTGYLNITLFKPANVTLLGVAVSYLTRFGRNSWHTPQLALYIVIFATWLSIVNFSLALVNALPLYITDGGRIVSIVLGEKIGRVVNGLGVLLLVLLIASSRVW